MKLGPPSAQYDAGDQARVRGECVRADRENLKKGVDLVLAPQQRIVLQDEVTGAYYRLKVASGVLSVVAYP